VPFEPPRRPVASAACARSSMRPRLQSQTVWEAKPLFEQLMDKYRFEV
jgi:hypothetical protein